MLVCCVLCCGWQVVTRQQNELRAVRLAFSTSPRTSLVNHGREDSLVSNASSLPTLASIGGRDHSSSPTTTAHSLGTSGIGTPTGPGTGTGPGIGPSMGPGFGTSVGTTGQGQGCGQGRNTPVATRSWCSFYSPSPYHVGPGVPACPGTSPPATLVRDGNLLWRITELSRLYRTSREKPNPSYEVFSEPFYTHSSGYRLVCSVFPNGNGSGDGSFLSVYVKLLPGEFDSLLQWPFPLPITFTLYDQNASVSLANRTNVTESFLPDPQWKHFQQPSASQPAFGFGYPRFIPHQALFASGGPSGQVSPQGTGQTPSNTSKQESSAKDSVPLPPHWLNTTGIHTGPLYIVDDVIFLKISVDSSNYNYPWLSICTFLSWKIASICLLLTFLNS